MACGARLVPECQRSALVCGSIAPVPINTERLSRNRKGRTDRSVRPLGFANFDGLDEARDQVLQVLLTARGRFRIDASLYGRI